MCNIVSEFSQWGVLRADVRIKRRASWVWLCIKPESIVVSAGCMISSEDVIWVGDPETGRCLIRVEETPGLLGIDRKVVFQEVIGFNGIFNEESVTFDVVSNI